MQQKALDKLCWQKNWFDPPPLTIIDNINGHESLAI